jgi:hypothetical protein
MPAQLPGITDREAVQELYSSFFVEAHVAPDKPRDLMIRFADGSDWNPGSGRGLYQYYGGAWHYLATP